MRTHTYWIKYEEYLAYGGVPPSTPIRGAIPYEILYKRGLRGATPYLTKKSGVYGVATPYKGGLQDATPYGGVPPCRVHIKFID